MSNTFNPSYVKPRNDLLKHISGNALTVLDVGCATGSNGQALLEQGIAEKVYGFEYDANMAEVASEVYDTVYVGDLDILDINASLEGKQFDAIIIGDVLEHLKDPWSVLSMLNEYLAPDGKAIISLPNIQHIDTFIHVYLKGTWPQNDRGIFDHTHLRFFTKKDMEKLINGAGLNILHFERQYRLRDKKGSKFKYSPIEALLKPIFKNLYTFQIVFVCQKRPS